MPNQRTVLGGTSLLPRLAGCSSSVYWPKPDVTTPAKLRKTATEAGARFRCSQLRTTYATELQPRSRRPSKWQCERWRPATQCWHDGLRDLSGEIARQGARVHLARGQRRDRRGKRHSHRPMRLPQEEFAAANSLGWCRDGGFGSFLHGTSEKSWESIVAAPHTSRCGVHRGPWNIGDVRSCELSRIAVPQHVHLDDASNIAKQAKQVGPPPVNTLLGEKVSLAHERHPRLFAAANICLPAP